MGEFGPGEASRPCHTGAEILEIDDADAGMGKAEGAPEEMRGNAKQVGEPAHAEAFVAEERNALFIGRQYLVGIILMEVA